MNASTLRLPSLAEIRQERTRRITETAADSGDKTVRERCQSLAGFVREAWAVLEPGTPYKHNWHIDAICAHLEAITNGTFLAMGLPNRLLINVPPGTLKSLLVSVFWPAWEWGPAGMPWLRFLSSSHSEDLTKRDTRRMRDLVASEWYQSLWGDKVQLTREGEESFANTAQGNREGMAFKSLTGGRGDRVIIDDPHSTEGSESEADRKKAVRIFRESLPSRVNNADSAIVIVMQRLHEQDVAGVALELGLGYIHLMLPMEFEPERRCQTPIFTDPRRHDGELLFANHFPPEFVTKLKLSLGAYGIAGQLQQRPAPREGLMFKRGWFQIVDAIPASFLYRGCRGWDFAASQTSSSPYTAGVKILSDGQRYLVAHVARDRVDGYGLETLLINTSAQDRTEGHFIDISIPQDPGQAGKIQAQNYIGKLAGHNAYASPESGDKIDRARPLAAQCEALNVLILRGPWNEEFLAELETFPAGKFKDQVDAASRAFGHLVLQPGVVMAGAIVVTGGRGYFGDHPEAMPPPRG